MKKLTLALLLVCSGLSAQAYQADIRTEQAYYPGSNCLADTSVDDWFGVDRLSFKAEFLYWRARQENTEYAYKNTVGILPIPAATSVVAGHKKDFNFGFDPAFRIALGYRLPCDGWDSNVNWTRYDNKAHSSTSGVITGTGTEINNNLATLISGENGANTSINDTLLTPLENGYNDISARHKIRFDNIEWTLGKRIGVSDCFSVRPYIGLKYVSIKQNLRVNAVRSSAAIVNSTATVGNRTHTKFDGLGLQGGLDATWALGGGFAIYSNASGGVAYGRAHAKQSIAAESTSLTAGAVNTISTYKNTRYLARPNVDFAIGLDWDACIYSYLVNVNLGWEYHHYFGQNLFRFANTSDNRGDLSFHGLTVGANIEF